MAKIIENKTVPLSSLKLWESNPRSITKEAFERLKQQIKELGVYVPLVVNEDMVVLSGNMRLRAFQDLKVDPVWVTVVEAKDPKTMLEYALSANDRAGYYEDQQLAELVLSVPDLNLGMFSVDIGKSMSLPDLMSRFGPDAEEDVAPDVAEGEPVSQLGYVYQLGKHRLMCGDATKLEDLAILMGDKKADMTFTDPPYNVDYGESMKDAVRGNKMKIMNDNLGAEFPQFLYDACVGLVAYTKGAIYICMSSSELTTLKDAFTKAGGHWSTFVIWAKNTFTMGRSDYQRQYEPILYGWKEGIDHFWCGARDEGDLWQIDRSRVNPLHPTQKPLELCVRAIRNSSKTDDIVLDTFGGSGSTLIACEQTGRICYMSELDGRYTDVIRRRYHKFVTGDEKGWEEGTPKI